MIEPLRWNTLEEAADWLTKKTGEPWTPRRILDAGEQGLINVRAVLPPNTEQSATVGPAYVGNTIKLDGVYLDSLLKHDSVYVSVTCDVPMGRDGVEVDIELTPYALISHKDLGVSRADLKAAGEALLAQREPPAPDAEAPKVPKIVKDEPDLAALFDPVHYEALGKMFPCDRENGWRNFADKAASNGLIAARQGRAVFNPMLAALWWLDRQHPIGWDLARINRVLAKCLPHRSKGNEHLFTGDYD